VGRWGSARRRPRLGQGTVHNYSPSSPANGTWAWGLRNRIDVAQPDTADVPNRGPTVRREPAIVRQSCRGTPRAGLRQETSSAPRGGAGRAPKTPRRIGRRLIPTHSSRGGFPLAARCRVPSSPQYMAWDEGKLRRRTHGRLLLGRISVADVGRRLPHLRAARRRTSWRCRSAGKVHPSGCSGRATKPLGTERGSPLINPSS